MGWISVTQMPQFHSTMYAFYLTSLKQYKMHFIYSNDDKARNENMFNEKLDTVQQRKKEVARDQSDRNHV